MWRTLTMSELYDLITDPESHRIFGKPTFPTRRWGKIYTLTATTDIKAINESIIKLKDSGKMVRKRICYETTNRIKHYGKFYKIEIKELCLNNT